MAKSNDPASPPVPPAPVDPRDAEIATLKAQLAEQGDAIKKLAAAMESGAVNTADANQQKKSESELEAFKLELAKGREKLTQEAADRQFPGGKHRYLCHLADGNGHPQIAIGADNEVDAAGRYMAVCGINSSEKKVSVTKA